jgi:hypothetical protein
MSLNSAIRMGCLLSKEDIAAIFEDTLDRFPYHAIDNCELYGEADRQGGCPGERSCSVQDLLLLVAMSAEEHFNKETSSIFMNIANCAGT